jgi:hypothetical protein
MPRCCVARVWTFSLCNRRLVSSVGDEDISLQEIVNAVLMPD